MKKSKETSNPFEYLNDKVESLSEIVKQGFKGLSNVKEVIPELIPRKKVAEHFGVDEFTIARWEKYKCLPPSIKVGGRIYFKVKELTERINSLQKKGGQNV